MDSEFINVYISRQKAWIEDLVAKQVILETKLHIAEQKIGERNSEIEVLKEDIDNKIAFINKLVETNAQKDELINSMTASETTKKKKKTDISEVVHQEEDVNDF